MITVCCIGIFLIVWNQAKKGPICVKEDNLSAATPILKHPKPCIVTMPYLNLQDRKKLKLDNIVHAVIWNFHGCQVKEFTARMLVSVSNKAPEKFEIKYVWNNASKHVDLELVYMTQDGSPFGVMDKRIPSLSLTSSNNEPSQKTVTKNSISVPASSDVKVSMPNPIIGATGKNTILTEVSKFPKSGLGTAFQSDKGNSETTDGTMISIEFYWKPEQNSNALATVSNGNGLTN